MAAPIIESSGPDVTRSPRRGRALVEASGTPEALPFADADEWRVIVTLDGTPCAYPRIASPGATDDPALLERLVVRHAAGERRRRGAVAGLVARMGGAAQPAAGTAATSVSVVLCTAGRPEAAARAAASLVALDPPPIEIIVVGNDLEPEPTRAVAERLGVRWVHEPRGGLDVARAAGVAAARGEIVAFTDDDCLVPPGWLRRVGELFADPTVGAVCGPAFADELATDSQRQRELVMPFVHGLELQRHDVTTLRPASSGAAGTGANMLLRRSLLLELGSPFPPELDVGTPTRGGGDLYALYAVLATGRRIVYDPATWVLHRHPAGPGATVRLAGGYGTAFAAFLTKVVVERGELAAPVHALWLVRMYLSALLWRTAGDDPMIAEIRARYLRGALDGPGAWRRARRRFGALGAPLEPGGSGAPERPPAEVELVVTNDTAGRNAAARASRAEVLVFLGESAEARAGLGRAHLAAHRDGGPPALVIGREEVRPGDERLASLHAALRAGTGSALTAEAIALTLADVPASNLSVRREAFLALGGFDATLGTQPAAQELAIRSGWRLERAPGALAVRVVSTTARGAVADADRAGRERAAIARRHPAAAGALCPVAPGALVRSPFAGALAVSAASVLERARLRRAWVTLVGAAERGAFAAGWRARGGPAAPLAPVVVELGDDRPLPPPGLGVPQVEVRAAGRLVARVPTPGGRWHPHLAEGCVDVLEPEDWRALGRAAAPRAPADAVPSDCAIVPAAAWPDVDAAIRTATATVVGVPLPGVRATPEWLADVAPLLRAERVAVAVGVGLADGELPRAAMLVSRRTLRIPCPILGPGPQYVAVRRDLFAALGGFDPAVARLGPEAMVLDLVDRALDAGHAVACLHTHGLTPPGDVRPARARVKWRSGRARGRLLAVRARDRGPLRGAAWLATQALAPPAAVAIGAPSATRRPSLRHLAGATLALVAGIAEEVR
jgi:glycosyltransferase involved in cell wall biosynthesis